METIMYLQKALSSVDFSVCRLCLSPDVPSEPLTQGETGKYLIQKIFDCTSVQIMPLTGIASGLCTDCKTRVEDFYLFRYQCIKNNEALNEFAAQFSKSSLVKSESETDGYFHELVQHTDDMSSISLQDQDPETNGVDNISLDHTYNAQETNIAHGFASGDGLELPEVKLEHNDDHTSEVLGQVDPLETEPKQLTNSETHEHIKMNIKEERNQCLRDAAPSTVQVLPQADLKLFQEPIERIQTDELLFVCKICDKMFKTRAILLKHAKIHNKDEHHRCPHCSASFVSRRCLVIHLRHHTGERPFECQLCEKRFISRSSLNSHNRIHNKDQQHQCPQCPSKLLTPGKLKIHMRNRHTGEKPYVCKTCNKAFSNSTILLKHRRMHTNGRQYQCPHCPAKFYDSPYLKIHIRYHTGERPYVCKVCDKAFYTSTHLITHCRTHNKDEQHQCTYCPARFAQPANLRIHIRRHTGEKPFMCEICAAKFTDETSLKSHIRRTHTSVQTHSNLVKCNICDKVLSSVKRLAIHQKTHQSSTTKLKCFISRGHASNQVECTMCNKVLSTPRGLSRHMKTHQPLPRQLETHAGHEMPSKPVECNICNKILSSLSSLWRHKKTHGPKLEADKKYQCPKCPSKFYESGALQRHIRHHTGERPYVCKVCGKAFHTSTNLKTHGKTHNKDQQQ